MSAATQDLKVIESTTSRRNISAITFTTDGHIFGGDEGGEVRRWRIEDGHQVGPTMRASGFVESIAVSDDGRWLVTGDDGRKGIVWDAQTHEKVLQVTEHTHFVYAVDIPSDSTRFATGSCDKTVRIFDITNGVRLIPPLPHDRGVVGLKFSLSGDRIATATYDVCVRVYDAYTGEKLISVPVRVMHAPTVPFAWSSDGQELFVVSPGKITCLNTFTSSRVEWSFRNNGTRASIVAYARFIACSTGPSVLFWDALSHDRLNPVIQHAPGILCISFSLHERLLACGHGNKISVHRLAKILPELYVPPLASDSSHVVPVSRPSLIPNVLLEPIGSIAGGSVKREDAVAQRSLPLPLDPTISAGLLIERSRDRAEIGLWEEALEDADEAIRMNPSCHYAYECKYISLHGMGRYDEANEAFDCMVSLIERSGDPETRQLRGKYVSSAQKRKVVEDTLRECSKQGPLVLIDVTTGRLCDRQLLPGLFKSDPTFKELVFPTLGEIDYERIQKTVNKYFGYAMFSHVWGGGIEEEKRNEPTFKAVKNSETVYRLPNTAMNNKLRNFCAKVTGLGFRWAWSDTCCIDKSDDAILNQSLRSMYKWYEASDATLVFLGDVTPELGDLLHSVWMTRAWTLQEALAPGRILFYDRYWKPYRGIDTDNHKKPGVILQELANATGVPRETLVHFHPNSLRVREKLRLASTRSATVEEDAAYSLIGIFKSDIVPRYGEGDDALGHLLEGVVTYSGDVTVLAWTGLPLSYNSCLPSSLAVYSRTPYTPTALNESDMESRTSQLSTAVPKDKVMNFYHRIQNLPPARFTNRRLQLPCIVFHVRSLSVEDFDGNRYCAKVSGLGTLKFTTTGRLPLAEYRRLVLVHPWISDIRGPQDEVKVDGSDSDADTDADSNGESGTTPMDEHNLALGIVVRLEQPFQALLLLRQPGGEYKRVAADNEIVAQVSEDYVKSKEVRMQVLDIL